MTSTVPDPAPADAGPEADQIVAARAGGRGPPAPRGARARAGGPACGGPPPRHDPEGAHWPGNFHESRDVHGARLPHGNGGHPGFEPGRGPGFGRSGGPGPRGGFGGPALLRLLGQLAHATEALSISELAERIGVDQPRASRLVQQAVERDFAVREADPEDARRTRVRLTEAGQQAVHGFRGRQRADMLVALEQFDPAERRELARLMTKLAAAWPEH